ncbi:hypothetical protein QSV08_03365 [Maribacter sp. BPC-D8]|uniref:hypothetical protein n=1 Tax=Maribacter sp. BPC-D8 TaxID=3053613 RepID=UPI002B4A96B5|nr:hypothetical protein [Maribacter sp. BPC-D8]WRI30283.1 hypothetical protein QSV08_03365 [Maribacter sp. BPC-D8]
MEIDKIISEVESLIEVGEKEFLQIEKTTKYYDDSEYYIVYHKAIKLLINEYSKKTESSINQFFEKRIPKLFDNRECEGCLVQFENLRSEDLVLRLQASKYFRGKALQETNGYRSILFTRPDTFDKLIKALKEEANEKVLINLIICIGSAHNRYFNHFRVFENLSPFFFHNKSEVKYYTIIWTRFIEDAGKAEILNIMNKQKQSKKVTAILKKYLNEGSN